MTGLHYKKNAVGAKWRGDWGEARGEMARPAQRPSKGRDGGGKEERPRAAEVEKGLEPEVPWRGSEKHVLCRLLR